MFKDLAKLQPILGTTWPAFSLFGKKDCHFSLRRVHCYVKHALQHNKNKIDDISTCKINPRFKKL